MQQPKIARTGPSEGVPGSSYSLVHDSGRNHEISSARQTHDAQKKLLESFSQALDGESRGATFTCGGTLPIVLGPNRDEDGGLTPSTEERVRDQIVRTKGVTIRWGSHWQGKVVQLPVVDSDGQVALEQLVNDSTPTTFGRGDEDVYDETYRRAGVMGIDEFMTDFCPYEAGIIDASRNSSCPPSPVISRGRRSCIRKSARSTTSPTPKKQSSTTLCSDSLARKGTT